LGSIDDELIKTEFEARTWCYCNTTHIMFIHETFMTTHFIRNKIYNYWHNIITYSNWCQHEIGKLSIFLIAHLFNGKASSTHTVFVLNHDKTQLVAEMMCLCYWYIHKMTMLI